MGWFENQIEERRQADQQMLEDSFVHIAGVVLGGQSARKISDEQMITRTAIDEILKYYHFKGAEIPDSLVTVEEQLDYCLKPHGLMRRNVVLTEGWYKDAFGPILAFDRETGAPTALLPGSVGGYYYKEPGREKRIKINARTAGLFRTEDYKGSDRTSTGQRQDQCLGGNRRRDGLCHHFFPDVFQYKRIDAEQSECQDIHGSAGLHDDAAHVPAGRLFWQLQSR